MQQFFINTAANSSIFARFYLWGGALLAGFGVLILIKPELLAILIAWFIIFVGVSMFMLGLKLRKPPGAAYRSTKIDGFEVD